MGRLHNGQWLIEDQFPSDTHGRFTRQPMRFRHRVTDHGQFQPASQRYHLYVSYACPWAHRTLIMRQLKSLQPHIAISVVDPDMLEQGWSFQQDKPGTTGDLLYQHQYLHQLYTQANPQQTSRVTVPVLWDTVHKTIVNNESADILRLFNSAFNRITNHHDDYYPAQWREAIDAWNARIYTSINNGVYACGFATTQSAYDIAVDALFTSLDQLDQHLQQHTYLVNNQLTEADIRLFPTLCRFDAVYHTHFKCNSKRIIDYPHLFAYLQRLRTLPAMADTTHMSHIKRHYFYSHRHINPFGIIPKGPLVY